MGWRLKIKKTFCGGKKIFSRTTHYQGDDRNVPSKVTCVIHSNLKTTHQHSKKNMNSSFPLRQVALDICLPWQVFVCSFDYLAGTQIA